MSYLSQQRGQVSVKAVVFPACVCGHPYPAHGCTACDCRTYHPNRPQEYRLSHGVARWRRVICEALWTIERQTEQLRERLERHS